MLLEPQEPSMLPEPQKPFAAPCTPRLPAAARNRKKIAFSTSSPALSARNSSAPALLLLIIAASIDSRLRCIGRPHAGSRSRGNPAG